MRSKGEELQMSESKLCSIQVISLLNSPSGQADGQRGSRAAGEIKNKANLALRSWGCG